MPLQRRRGKLFEPRNGLSLYSTRKTHWRECRDQETSGEVLHPRREQFDSLLTVRTGRRNREYHKACVGGQRDQCQEPQNAKVGFRMRNLIPLRNGRNEDFRHATVGRSTRVSQGIAVPDQKQVAKFDGGIELGRFPVARSESLRSIMDAYPP